MIPRRIVFVWMGRQFPFFCRLAVESALQANPDATVEIHLHGPCPGSVDFAAVSAYPRVEIHDIDDLAHLFGDLDEPASRYLELFERIPESAASARSNLLRYGILHRRGGVYVDFDVLFLRGLDDLLGHPAFIGQERVWKDGKAREAGECSLAMGLSGAAWLTSFVLRRVDAHALGGRRLLEGPARAVERAWATYNQNNAVIGSEPGGRFIRRVLHAALDQSPTVRFALGPTLVTRVVADDDSDVYCCPEQTLYPVPPSCSFQFFHGAPPAVSDDTVLIHYVASNHKRLLADLDVGAVRASTERGLFYQLARDVVRRMPAAGSPPR